ncbi:two-component regulator propeller domain-containing protein [Robiginitalea sp. SC105]|uniref:sensor histidine kinase n=1 Tax=Robiginitalea sp. SC105 TaxID=2762332 RepID=UPI00163B115A|nr:two-component regulator propeller domain-containing protein [Robiginitalea sp. SC105]MBC2839784.1 hypothetical protein [Robiginitalea sp. SC105]
MEFFRHDPQDKNSLGGPYPETFFVEDSGIIWIGFYGQGLDRFDPRTNTFTHYRHDPEEANSLTNDNVWAILEDHLDNLWVATENGLDLLDRETGAFRHFKHIEGDSSSLSCNNVRSLYEDRSGTLWVGTGMAYNNIPEGGLNRLNRESGTFTRFMHDPEDPTSLISNKVRAILEDSQGNFWVGTDGDGLHTMDRETGTFTRHTYDPDHPEKLSRPPDTGEPFTHITFLTEDAEGHIWVGTEHSGINRYDPKTDTFTFFGDSPTVPETVLYNESWKAYTESNSGWCALATQEGHIWLSTQQQPKFFKVDLFSNEIPLKGNIWMKNFYEENRSILWKGGWSGLIREDLDKGTVKAYRHNADDAGSISSNQINFITKDRLNKLWIATNNGLNTFEPVTEYFMKYLPEPDDPESLSDPRVNHIYEDSGNNLWVGTSGGLNLLDRNSGRFRVFRSNTTDVSSISSDIITVIGEDAQQNLWIGTMEDGAGVNRYIPASGTFKRYLPGLAVLSLLLDENGIFWAGTAIGLYRYDPETDQFVDTGISSDITLVIDDTENNLWIYNSRGIMRYDPETGSTLVYGEKNGVRGILQLSLYSFPYRKKDGTILFGAEGGYYAFNPDDLWVSRDTSLLYVTDFRINGNSGFLETNFNLEDWNAEDEAIELNYSQNVFSILFAAIDFRNSGQNQLLYMLENYDLGWLEGKAGTPANYFKVPPGEYTFRLKALNGSSGIWSEKAFPMVILPPWWGTWWAYCLYALLLALGVWLIHNYQKERVLREERQKAQKKELEHAREIEQAYNKLQAAQTQLIHSEKMASLGELTAGIAHEIQNPLNFVNNFSEVNRELLGELMQEVKKGDKKEADAIAKDLFQNLEKIEHHGKRAEGIVKGMLQHSRSSESKKEPTDLNKLADEYLRLAYHGLRAKDKSFNAIMETDFDPGLPEISVIPQDIGRVLLNLLTNAFHAVQERQKQGEAGYEPTVAMSTRRTPDGVEIRVTDNGGGIPEGIREKIFQPFFTTKPTGEGTGLGLSMSYDIVTKGHGGALTFSNCETGGTEFLLHLPKSLIS